ncbi:uncharacterized protein PAN0_032d6253 [Moesziomyces antarcticus]|uniref:Uncharacterized protein n=2 Tax=Pseudozyma antarctica TaxID=84753 RepID=A0A5C3FYD5_PSEA2|nr:uncharacterized protein PAN0_032d6253 [Moesziomyces antarcticus]GAK68023.1 hypothetical protein PAN0_032d6253 [Moesziomyces antarcticus]SPO49240.1 uncharacterized protein PSANT_06931 [Moesziomyces antarcticus]
MCPSRARSTGLPLPPAVSSIRTDRSIGSVLDDIMHRTGVRGAGTIANGLMDMGKGPCERCRLNDGLYERRVRGDCVLIDTVESSLLVDVGEASQLAFAAPIYYPDED